MRMRIYPMEQYTNELEDPWNSTQMRLWKFPMEQHTNEIEEISLGEVYK
jgi:hypothetical protein